MFELLVATHNRGKVAELGGLFSGLPIKLRYLAEFPGISEIEETGGTFVENARIKARGYAVGSGIMAIADDSGLEVAALGGRPGIHSARYGGKDIGFDRKIAMLLSELSQVPVDKRHARFVCAAAIADKHGNILFESTGICNGTIAEKPLGKGGFGYDPIFVPDGFDETFGELSTSVKEKISHRARAFNEIIPFLRDFIAV